MVQLTEKKNKQKNPTPPTFKLSSSPSAIKIVAEFFELAGNSLLHSLLLRKIFQVIPSLIS